MAHPLFEPTDQPGVSELIGALFRGTADAIVVVDEAGRIALANDSCRRLLGHAPAELQGQPLDVLIPARIRGHEAHRQRFNADPHPRPMGRGLDLVLRHSDGHEVAVDITLTPLVVGGRAWTAAVVRDMRGRESAAESLRVQATALRAAANGIVITNTAGQITWVNPAACAITGYSAEELVGQHTRILKSGRHDPGFYAALWETIRRGQAWSGTIVNRRKDGSLYDEEQTIAPVLDAAGEVTHFIAIKQDVTARRRAEDALARAHAELAERARHIELLNHQLLELAIRDPLTNVYNRRYLEPAITRDVARARRTGEPVSVAALDLDHFKRVNDAHGHAAGDAVLKEITRRLSSELRESDLVARVGGEEFVVVLPGTTLEEAREAAERWRARVSSEPVALADGTRLAVTLSAGVVQLRLPDETADALLRRADAALFDAKRAGRDRVISAA